jgi:ribonuclease BN (tRNA processing enzyme)
MYHPAMQITVLGGSGAWPTAEEACSGFLLEHDGFHLLIDVGYATLPRLLALVPVARIDAVVISHEHPDHCADLNPLLRARALTADPAPALPVFALPGALDAVLALDRPGMLDDALSLREFDAGDEFTVGPFALESRLLPHWVPNAGIRVSADGLTLAYTGDTGPDSGVVALAKGADLLIAEATSPEQRPEMDPRYTTSARQAATQAAKAGVGSLLLTHLRPDTDPAACLEAAASAYYGETAVARSGLSIELQRTA